jgi:hypothetical protein
MGKLVCRVELDKTKGIVLTVENGQGKITQTIVMDGTSITTTVKGQSDTSKITQKDNSIEIDCKNFTLNADTIHCKSKGATSHESGQNFEIKSGQNINATATGDAKYKAMNTAVESTAETKISGMTVKLSGTTSAEVKGASVTVEATGMMDLKSSGIANIKGSIVNIKDIVNIG